MGAYGNTKDGRCESADDYPEVVCVLNDRWRVIVCSVDWQWVLQKSKSAGRRGRAWRGKRYFLTRDALIKACAQLCEPCDAAVLACIQALPEHFSPGANETS